MASHCMFLASRLSRMAHGKEFDTTWILFSYCKASVLAGPNAYLICNIS
jgi:hypothetical protein